MHYKIVKTGPGRVELIAPAKVNLVLCVHNRRKDGYHNLTTLMQEITLCDRLRLRKTEKPGVGLKLTRPARGVPIGRENLVCRAAQAFFLKTGIRKGVEIELLKKIPSGAGLGGGSSDAASTLIGLNTLFKAGLPQNELARLAATLGSDVPFFIYGKTAICRGRGEKVAPFKLPRKLHYAIVFPHFPVSTRLIYENLKERGLTNCERCSIIIGRKGKGKRAFAVLYNSLEAVVFKFFPKIAEVKLALEKTSGIKNALVTGSGSAIFGLCQNRCVSANIVKNLNKNLRQVLKKFSVFAAETL